MLTPCTNNLAYFWEFLDYLNPNSLEILCYQGQSSRNVRHHISLSGLPPDAMSKEEFDRRVKEEVDKWIKEQDHKI